MARKMGYAVTMRYPTTAEIEELTPDERLQLIADVWTTLEKKPEQLAMPEEHRKIVQERLAEHRRSPNDTLSWEEVKDRISRKGK